MLNLLASGFLKGGTGFLKGSTAGDMIKGGASVNREIRVGITHVRCQPGLERERERERGREGGREGGKRGVDGC